MNMASLLTTTNYSAGQPPPLPLGTQRFFEMKGRNRKHGHEVVRLPSSHDKKSLKGCERRGRYREKEGRGKGGQEVGERE